jgi:hypothetical protein
MEELSFRAEGEEAEALVAGAGGWVVVLVAG